MGDDELKKMVCIIFVMFYETLRVCVGPPSKPSSAAGLDKLGLTISGQTLQTVTWTV